MASSAPDSARARRVASFDLCGWSDIDRYIGRD
jgi:hypothetical protein